MSGNHFSTLLACLFLTGCTITKPVVIKTEPPASTVLINGVDAGISPVTRKLEFPSRAATFQATARKSGYQDGKITISYEPTNQKEYVIQLGRLGKTIKLQTQPEGATLFLDGQPGGISPLTKELLFDSQEQSIEVTARKEGYKDGKTNISYLPGNQSDYQITLEKIETIPMELVSVEPQKTDQGVKLMLTRKPTLGLSRSH